MEIQGMTQPGDRSAIYSETICQVRSLMESFAEPYVEHFPTTDPDPATKPTRNERAVFCRVQRLKLGHLQEPKRGVLRESAFPNQTGVFGAGLDTLPNQPALFNTHYDMV